MPRGLGGCTSLLSHVEFIQSTENPWDEPVLWSSFLFWVFEYRKT